MVVKVKDAKTTRKESKCSAYDNTKKAVCICVACNCFCSLRKVKAESEAAERSDYLLLKKSTLQYAGVDGKDREKKHGNNERED